MTDRPVRLFTPSDLEAGASLTLAPAQAHYLGRVMRCRTGDRIRLFNAASGEWLARLAVGRREVEVRVEERVRAPVRAAGPVLAMPPIRRARLEWAVEKATELGIAAFQPVITERSGTEAPKPERLLAIAVEAAEQSERLSVPEVRPLRPLGTWLAERAPTPLFVALEREAAPSLLAAAEAHGPGDLLIGPEGGFGARDRALLTQAKAALAVSLGAPILRAETAAIAGLAVLAMLRPDARIEEPARDGGSAASPPAGDAGSG
jgi:16S rRNA (uracil1498-N3)-methyltransferase